MARFDDPAYFDISNTYSVVYRRFLEMDLSQRPAIRGQLEGPISFGFNVVDQDDRPILFDEVGQRSCRIHMAIISNGSVQSQQPLCIAPEQGLFFIFGQ